MVLVMEIGMFLAGDGLMERGEMYFNVVTSQD